MKRVVELIISFLLTTVFCFISVSANSVRSVINADLDGDGIAERIELDSNRDVSLTVRRGRRLVWQGVHGRWKPWKLAVSDVDGDGKLEIIVGAYKATYTIVIGMIVAAVFCNGLVLAQTPTAKVKAYTVSRSLNEVVNLRVFNKATPLSPAQHR